MSNPESDNSDNIQNAQSSCGSKGSQKHWLKISFIAFVVAFSGSIILFIRFKYGDLIIYYYHRNCYHTNTEYDKLFAQWPVKGIDVSQYQGKINWDKVGLYFGEHKITFTFIRATAGKDKIDNYFNYNWDKSKERGFIRGAYHYYRPDENSTEQANNFINTVTLSAGDLPPVLDIEQLPDKQSIGSLKKGLQNWLTIVENQYGVQPIIYSGDKYFNDHLSNEFCGYKIWIANHNRVKRPLTSDWIFWQYSSKGIADGINHHVDINVFRKDKQALRKLCLQ